MEHSGFLGEQAGSRVVAALGPELGRKQPSLSERESMHLGRGRNAKLRYSSRGNHRMTLQGDRTAGLGICQSKMLFHLAAWGGLFLPLASLGGDEGPCCGLCTALESGLSNLGKALSFCFFLSFVYQVPRH